MTKVPTNPETAQPEVEIKMPCEVYSRIVGYLRPVQNWHEGKQQEFKERKTFQVPEAGPQEEQSR